MIIDKKSLIEKSTGNATIVNPDIGIIGNEPEGMDGNPLADIYRATAKAIRGILKDPEDPNSGPLFKTVKLNTGQLNRLKHDKHNYQDAISFPAAFIHMINVRWLIQTSRIGEGRGELRICYALNRLNNDDEEHQTESYEIFQRINEAINNAKSDMPVYSERFQLTFWDQVENYDDAIQQCWITYEVWFKDYKNYAYKDYIPKYIVIPPFTNHSDQSANVNIDQHLDHEEDESASKIDYVKH